MFSFEFPADTAAILSSIEKHDQCSKAMDSPKDEKQKASGMKRHSIAPRLPSGPKGRDLDGGSGSGGEVGQDEQVEKGGELVNTRKPIRL